MQLRFLPLEQHQTCTSKSGQCHFFNGTGQIAGVFKVCASEAFELPQDKLGGGFKPIENISQIGSFSQIGMKIKNL